MRSERKFSPAPTDIDLPSLTDKVAGDLVYIRERLERSGITKAEELVSDLMGSASPRPFILHADFSLRNMLDAGAPGFIAIDPWGAVGDRAFDVATWAAEHPPTLIEERASTLAASLGLEEGRVLAWTRVLALLGAAVLFLHGDQDRIVPSSHAKWLARHTRSAELWLRPDDGHISVLNSGVTALGWL